LNRKVEILISRGGDFVCACFFFGFGRHIEIPLSTSVAPLRQGKSKTPLLSQGMRILRHFSTGKMRGAEPCQERKEPHVLPNSGV
jgi:hypothetical protein